ncbi:MAG: alpha/beta hydrolase family protein [Bryobacteraceae bacterium]
MLRLPLLVVSAAVLAASAVTPEQEQQWRALIRKTLFISDSLPALAPETHGRFEPEPGVIAERVTYGTQFGMRIPAILYRPKAVKGKAPALIVVNGHGGDKYSWYAFYTGILYARAGAVVLTYDPAGEGERNIDRKSGTRAHDKVEPPAELAQRLAGLMATDLMQAVSYLRSRPEVDPARIAATGYSLGSFVVCITGAIETRLRACIPVGGGNLDGPGEYWDRTKPMCVGTPYRSLMVLGDRPAIIYALHASRGPALVFNGTGDDVVAIPTHLEPFFEELRKRVVLLRGRREGVFETAWEQDTSHRPYFVTRPVVLWLERILDLPNWNAGEIARMPETHISEWAAERGVPLDPLYATEKREGGTRALGAGVPGLTRDQLSVFSFEQWSRQKDRMIHETWLKQAKSRIGAAQ